MYLVFKISILLFFLNKSFAATTVAEFDIYGVVKTKDKKGLRVRSCPSVNCTIVGSLKEGEGYYFSDRPIGKWLKINGEYYVHGDYIKISAGNKREADLNEEMRDYVLSPEIDQFLKSFSLNQKKEYLISGRVKKHFIKEVVTYLFNITDGKYKYPVNITNYKSGGSFSVTIGKVTHCGFVSGDNPVFWETYRKGTKDDSDHRTKFFEPSDGKLEIIGIVNEGGVTKRARQKKSICVVNSKDIIRAKEGGGSFIIYTKYNTIFTKDNPRILPAKSKGNLLKSRSRWKGGSVEYRDSKQGDTEGSMGSYNDSSLKYKVSGGAYAVVHNGFHDQVIAFEDIVIDKFLKLKKGETIDLGYYAALKKFKKIFGDQVNIGRNYGVVGNMEQLNHGTKNIFFDFEGLKLGAYFEFTKDIRVRFDFEEGNLALENRVILGKVETKNRIFTFLPTLSSGVRKSLDEHWKESVENESTVLKLYPYLAKYELNNLNIKSIDAPVYNRGAYVLTTKKSVMIDEISVPAGSKIRLNHVVLGDFIELYSINFNGKTRVKETHITKGDIAYFRGGSVFRINRGNKMIYSKYPIVVKSNKIVESGNLKGRLFCLLSHEAPNPMGLGYCDSGDLDRYEFDAGGHPKHQNPYVIKGGKVEFTWKHDSDTKYTYNLSDLITSATLIYEGKEYFLNTVPNLPGEDSDRVNFFKKGGLLKLEHENGAFDLYDNFCGAGVDIGEDPIKYKVMAPLKKGEKAHIQINYRILTEEFCSRPGC